ncbi:phage tail tape measure protein [Bremerella sp. T1]|uniref:phage tail tape measure protein n=1 Tax=Bremerella sp. TYQ1 TaxID=3119568 RepID=UPI001CCA56FB|nr:phage tail tape measure protein [Bremerella volcania]UBM38428.1 phage tail tape measure protein [Bremerella volcania]
MATGGVRAGAAFIELYVKNGLDKGLRKARAKLQTFSNSVQNIGRNLTSVAAVGAAPLAIAATTYANFADKMAEVRAVTGATERQFGQLEAKARELGATTSYSASQVAEAMKFLGMAGFNPDQITAGIPAVLNLARAGSTDLATAADIASDVGSAFGLTADELGHVADVMATTASSANTSIEMMGETLKYAAPLAKAAGQSIEDTAAAIGVLGNNGIKASMAGTDMAEIMKSIGSKSVKGIEAIGVKTSDAEGNIRNLLDVMKDIGAATAEMGQAERLAFFEASFGRAAKSALILADSGDAMDDLRKKIDGAEGSAAEMAAMMDDNLGGAFRRFMSAFEGMQISIGKALDGPLQDWINWGGEALGSIEAFISANPQLVTSIAAIIAIAGAAGVGFLGLAFVLNIVVGAITGVVTVVGVLSSIIGLLFTPLGAGIAILAALVIAFTDFGSAANAASGMIADAFKYVEDTVNPILESLLNALRSSDWELAAKILWQGVKVVFLDSMAEISKEVEIWKEGLTSVLKDVASFNSMIAGGPLLEGFWHDQIDTAADMVGATSEGIEIEGKRARNILEQLQKEANEAGKLQSILDGLPGVSAYGLEDLEGSEKLDAVADIADAKPQIELPDLEGVGDQVAKAWEMAVGTSNSFAVDRIGLQARPMERVENELREVNNKLAELVEQGEDADTFAE